MSDWLTKLWADVRESAQKPPPVMTPIEMAVAMYRQKWSIITPVDCADGNRAASKIHRLQLFVNRNRECDSEIIETKVLCPDCRKPLIIDLSTFEGEPDEPSKKNRQ